MNATPDPRLENGFLRRLLQTLNQDAAYNQQVMARFQERELSLLGAPDLVSLLRCLTAGMRRSFSLESVKLILLDPYDVLRELLDASPDDTSDLRRDMRLEVDVSGTRQLFGGVRAPMLSPWDDDQHRPIFGRSLQGSVALLPLRQPDGLAGYLCLGSTDRQRFQAGQATDFLAHLACVAAVCLENAVNRERLRVAGLTDSLTGLYNRRHLEHRLTQEITRAQRYGQPLSCLFVDADHFKKINDRFGHSAGDLVLVALAGSLRARLRTSDLATRYGGEEFALLLPHTDQKNACRLAHEICATVASRDITLEDDQHIRITVSIGVASLDLGTKAPAVDLGETLLKAADEAVYEAKAAGRNCVVCAAGAGSEVPS